MSCAKSTSRGLTEPIDQRLRVQFQKIGRRGRYGQERAARRAERIAEERYTYAIGISDLKY